MSFENRKTRVGTVVSDKMDKSVIVSVAWRTQHPRYRKSIRRRSRLMVHDPEGQVSVGDLVRIVEVRPLSKMKRWRISEVIARQEIVEIPSAEEVVREAIPDEPTPIPAPKRKATEVEPPEETLSAEEEAVEEPKPRKSRAKASTQKAEEPVAEAEPDVAEEPEAAVEAKEVEEAATESIEAEDELATKAASVEEVEPESAEEAKAETESAEDEPDDSADSVEEENDEDEEKERQ